jgi:hypothetical protein
MVAQESVGQKSGQAIIRRKACDRAFHSLSLIINSYFNKHDKVASWKKDKKCH